MKEANQLKINSTQALLLLDMYLTVKISLSVLLQNLHSEILKLANNICKNSENNIDIYDAENKKVSTLMVHIDTFYSWFIISFF